MMFEKYVEIVEFDDVSEEHTAVTYYEHDEVMAVISDLKHKNEVLEYKCKTLSDNYNELIRQKLSLNEGYWKKKCIELMNTIKSFEENL